MLFVRYRYLINCDFAYPNNLGLYWFINNFESDFPSATPFLNGKQLH